MVHASRIGRVCKTRELLQHEHEGVGRKEGWCLGANVLESLGWFVDDYSRLKISCIRNIKTTNIACMKVDHVDRSGVRLSIAGESG
jgi:hypothetical protein